LGCTLYYALCGKVPFPGGDTKSKLRRHLEETPWHPRKFAPDVPEDFVDIIADMMEKDPTKRIASAAQVAARLEPWVSDDQEVGSVGLGRSPWMAPPPPSHSDSSDSSIGDRNSTEYPGSTDGSVAQETRGQLPPVPGESQIFTEVASLSGSATTSVVNPSRTSMAMIIALTVAIVVPPALLLGAILGFIIASR
jgi:eukaryotic-like serine/threonine-protein kinase